MFQNIQQLTDQFFSQPQNCEERNLRAARLRDSHIVNVIRQWGIIKEGMRGLDVGCGIGRLTKRLEEEFAFLSITGVDGSTEAIKRAKELYGIDVHYADIALQLPFVDCSFDVIFCTEVLEHLYDPDRILEEIHRVLKPGGYFFATTPNLASFFNRVLLLFGLQPLFLEVSTRDKTLGMGFLRRLKKIPEQPAGHIRLFTKRSLCDMLRRYQFTVCDVRGLPVPETMKPFTILDRLFSHIPSLATDLIVCAKKS